MTSSRRSAATSVGGATAQLIDAKSAIAERLPYALAIIVVATFVLLFLMFGSVLVPLKAIVLNVLSLSATFGAMIWVFQEGHGSGILDFTATGSDRHDDTDPDVLHRVRSVDGLRGVPALPHQGGVRPHGRQRGARWPSDSSAPVAS